MGGDAAGVGWRAQVERLRGAGGTMTLSWRDAATMGFVSH